MSTKIVQLKEEVLKELVRGSVEEALIEMYLAGVSVRRVEDIREALWGSKKYMNMKHLEAAFGDSSIAG